MPARSLPSWAIRSLFLQESRDKSTKKSRQLKSKHAIFKQEHPAKAEKSKPCSHAKCDQTAARVLAKDFHQWHDQGGNMAKKFTRRDFIKTSSLSAAGVSMLSFNPLVSALESASPKSRVVIATDQQSFQNNAGSQTEIQTMVDQAVMSLTGITDKVAAYESLFPGLTTAKKIVIKYNAAKPATTRQLVTTALTNSLKLMLNGTFPAANITLVGNDSGAAGSSSFQIGTTTYTIRNTWANCDYFINCPSCYSIDSGCGVTMSLKNMITSFTGGAISSMHSYFTSATTPALSLLNSQAVFKQKQALVLMDAVIISPNGSATMAGYSIIASKDMVALDYQGIQLLKANGLTSALETAGLSVCGLAAASPYSIGTNLPANMDVVRIGPPWATEVLSSGSALSSVPRVEAKTGAGRTVFSYEYGRRKDAVCTVYAMNGALVWSGKGNDATVAWEHVDLAGRTVASGTYVYMLKIDDITARGIVLVKR
jgi:Domain of unknown function (DUF362)